MSEKRKFQLSIKFGPGYEAPMVNVEGDTAEEFRENVEFAASSVEAIVEAAVLFQAAYNVKKPQDKPAQSAPQTSSWSRSGSQQQTQAAPSGQPDGPPPSCKHGEMRWRPPGISQRTKKAYNGFWACTGPRDDPRDPQCQSVNG